MFSELKENTDKQLNKSGKQSINKTSISTEIETIKQNKKINYGTEDYNNRIEKFTKSTQ